MAGTCKVYGMGESDRYVEVTLYACGDGEEILWSFHETPDVLMSDEEAASHGLPHSLAIRCNVTRTSFVISQTDDKSVIYDIVNEMLADMYPNFVPTVGDNVSIYEDNPSANDEEFDPRNDLELESLYDVMQYEK